MSAEATAPDAVIPAKARNRLDAPAPSRRHSRESGNPLSFARYPKYKDSGVEWLGEVPDEWSIVRLKQACAIAPSNVDKKSYDGQQAVRLCNYTDVYYNDEITEQIEFMAASATDDQVAKFSLRANDVLITKDSETPDDIAVPAYVTRDLSGVVCGYHLALLRPFSNCSGKYLKYLFHSRYLRSTFAVAANGLTRYGLSQYALDNAEIPFPRHYEQVAIATFLDRETAKIDALIAEQEKLIALLKEKRQALISHAVTKGLDPNAPMKDSGIEWLGQVPAHWDVLPMRWHFECASGKALPADEVFNYQDDSHSVPVIGGNWVMGHTSRANVDAGVIVVGRVGALCGNVHFVGTSAWVTDNALIIKPTSELFEPRYVSEALRARSLNDIASKTAQPLITGTQLLDQRLPCPPMLEQKVILDTLEEWNERSESLLTDAIVAIDLLKERRAALISAAVTGKIDVRNV